MIVRLLACFGVIAAAVFSLAAADAEMRVRRQRREMDEFWKVRADLARRARKAGL